MKLGDRRDLFSDLIQRTTIGERSVCPQASNQQALVAIHDKLQYFPAVCGGSLGLRLGKGQFQAGGQVTVDGNGKFDAAGNFRLSLFQFGKSSAGFSTDGATSGKLNYSYSIPGTPVAVGFNTMGDGTVSSVNASFRRPIAKGLFNITVSVRLTNAYRCN